MIGISYGPREQPYPRYGEAVHAAAKRLRIDVETLDLREQPENAETIDGLLLTGGGDIAPQIYGKGDETAKCYGIDPERDALELGLCETARRRQLPILGVCRGLQLLNVYFGGTLIADIPTAPSHKRSKGEDARHSVTLRADSLVAQLAHAQRAEVNSSHHQAVDKLAPPFAVTARADDGTIEALEWTEPDDKPFLLAVQWHPERMNQEERLAGPIFEQLARAALSFSKQFA